MHCLGFGAYRSESRPEPVVEAVGESEGRIARGMKLEVVEGGAEDTPDRGEAGPPVFREDVVIDLDLGCNEAEAIT